MDLTLELITHLEVAEDLRLLSSCAPSLFIPTSGKTVILNLWAMTPLLLNDAFARVTCQIFTLWFITVAKIQLWSSNENYFILGGHHKMGNCILKDCSIRKVENHCLTRTMKSSTLPVLDFLFNQHLQPKLMHSWTVICSELINSFNPCIYKYTHMQTWST